MDFDPRPRGRPPKLRVGGFDDPPAADPQQPEPAETLDPGEEINGLESWIDSEAIADSAPKIWLYRFERDETTRRVERVLVERLASLLDPHDVGLIHGGGRYEMIVALDTSKSGGRKGRIFRFTLGSNYNKTPGSVPSVVSSPAAASSLSDGLAIIDRVLKTIQPLLSKGSGDTPAQMLQMYQLFGDMMRDSAVKNQKLLLDMQKMMLEGDERDEDDPPEPQQTEAKGRDMMTEILLGLAEEYLPKVLGGGEGAAKIVKLIRDNQQFSRITSDPTEKGKLLVALDKRFGAEQVDKFLSACGVSR